MDGIFSTNAAQSRFEYKVDGHTAFANFRQQDGKLYIDYVEAPQALRGTGAAGQLMEHIMQKLRADNVKAVPICGYAVSWLRRHNEYQDMVA